MVERGAEQPFAWRAGLREDGHVGACHAGGNSFKGGGVKGFLASEVVVKKSFVYARGFGDSLGSSPGESVGAELASGGLKDSSARLVGAFRVGASWGGQRHLLTNWLVK
jgi:hypothetical protein